MGADIPLFEILIVNNDESNDMMRILLDSMLMI